METEVERQYRVVDQMLSMHSTLRDRYKRRAFVLNTLQIAISVFLAAFAFVSDAVLCELRVQPDLARFVIATAAVAMLGICIVEVRADWRGASGRHADAVRRLSALKPEYRKVVAFGMQAEDLNNEYNRMLGDTVPIPEKLFVSLKAIHQYKRLLSEEISKNPGVPRWVLGVRLRVRSIQSMLGARDRAGKSEEDSDAQC